MSSAWKKGQRSKRRPRVWQEMRFYHRALFLASSLQRTPTRASKATAEKRVSPRRVFRVSGQCSCLRQSTTKTNRRESRCAAPIPKLRMMYPKVVVISGRCCKINSSPKGGRTRRDFSLESSSPRANFSVSASRIDNSLLDRSWCWRRADFVRHHVATLRLATPLRPPLALYVTGLLVIDSRSRRLGPQ